MKIPATQAFTFQPQDYLAPQDLNTVFRVAAEGVAEAARRRYQHGLLLLQFSAGPNAPYTNATPAAVRTFRFLCPNTCIVERAILTAQLTSSAEVRVGIVASGTGIAPAGATTPWLSTKGAAVQSSTGITTMSSTGAITSASDVVSDTNADRVLLVAGTEYTISVTSAGTFTLGRADLQLHTLTDRFNPSGTANPPLYVPAPFSDAVGDATAVALNKSLLTTETNKLANVTAPIPVVFQVHGLTSSTPLGQRQFALPRFSSTRARVRIIRGFLRVEMASAGASGQVVSGTVFDTVPATRLLASSGNLNGLPGASVQSAPALVDLTAVGVSAATAANDYTVVFTNSAPAPAAAKATLLLWLSRT